MVSKSLVPLVDCKDLEEASSIWGRRFGRSCQFKNVQLDAVKVPWRNGNRKLLRRMALHLQTKQLNLQDLTGLVFFECFPFNSLLINSIIYLFLSLGDIDNCWNLIEFQTFWNPSIIDFFSKHHQLKRDPLISILFYLTITQYDKLIFLHRDFDRKIDLSVETIHIKVA